MISRIGLVLTALLLAAVCVADNPQYQIGSKISRKDRKAAKREHAICMTSPADLDECFHSTVGGVRFLIAFDRTKKVALVFTDDEKFRTTSGSKVGHILQLPSAGVRFWPGWHVHGPKTEDGWWPVLGVPDVVCSDHTTVKWKDYSRGKTCAAVIQAFAKTRR